MVTDTVWVPGRAFKETNIGTAARSLRWKRTSPRLSFRTACTSIAAKTARSPGMMYCSTRVPITWSRGLPRISARRALQ